MTVAGLCAIALAAAAGDIVARVDGVQFSRAHVAERASELRSRGLSSAPEQAVDSLVLEALLSGEARRNGLANDAGVRARIERDRERAAASVFLEKELTPTLDLSDAELRNLYHARADSVRLQLLAFPTEDAARVSLAIVQRSGMFEDAKRSPVPGFSVPGSDSPQIRGQMPPALAVAAFETPLGGTGGPVEIASGWAIFKVLERKVADDHEFAAMRESIAQLARKQAANIAREHARRRLREKARIVVDDAFLAALGKRRDVTGAEMEHVVATVNGEPVRYRDVAQSVQQLSAASGHGTGPEVRRQLLMSEIEDRLLESAAMERGFGVDPLVVARVPAIERRVLAAAFVERVGSQVPPPTEREIRAFYRANVQRTGQRLEAVRGAIATRLRENRVDEVLVAKAKELRSRANVTVDQKALRGSEGK